MRFPFFRNRDSVKNGILISIRRTGDGFHPGLFISIFRITSKFIFVSIVLSYFEVISTTSLIIFFHCNTDSCSLYLKYRLCANSESISLDPFKSTITAALISK